MILSCSCNSWLKNNNKGQPNMDTESFGKFVEKEPEKVVLYIMSNSNKKVLFNL